MGGTDPDAPPVNAIGVLDELVGYHLRRASAVFGSDFARAVAGEGLRQVPFAILSVIGANPGIRQGAAGSLLGIQRANMVALISELVEAGHVDRRQAGEDRRAFALTLTPAGAALLARSTSRLLAHEAALLADFSPEERRGLIALIRRIAAREQPADD